MTTNHTVSDASSHSEPVTQANDERSRLLSEIKKLKDDIKELRHTADTDPLVPVYNRRAFIREIKRVQSVMHRYDMLSSIIFLDLDNFKSINDRYGHSFGDQVLVKLGKTLQKHVRDCDMVARIGGDEFGILLFKADHAVAQGKAQSLAQHLSEKKISISENENLSIGVSWGVSVCQADDTAEKILERADRAMYAQKPTGTK